MDRKPSIAEDLDRARGPCIPTSGCLRGRGRRGTAPRPAASRPQRVRATRPWRASTNHFHRVFRALVGETVGEHVRRLRLERAALRLSSTDRPVVQVAFDGHFSPNPTAFRRKALSEQLLAMISASASDNRSSERLSLIDRRTVEASAKGNYRPLAASPSPSCSRRLSGSARSVVRCRLWHPRQQFPGDGFSSEKTLVLISHFADLSCIMLLRIPHLTSWVNGVAHHGTCSR